MRRLLAVSLVSLSLGCGSTPEPQAPAAESAPAASAEPTATAEAKPAADDGGKLPEACDGDASACVMPRGFVKRLCSKVYPELALYMFRKGAPWRHVYLSIKEAAPFNGLGGPSAEEKLVFDEEVLILSEKKADTGGMQVSGAGGTYDVLRWDGTCATISSNEARSNVPPKPKHATVPYRILEDATQDALKQNANFAAVVDVRRKECKGATMGAVSAKCEQADRKLNELVVDVVRGGAAIPLPQKRP